MGRRKLGPQYLRDRYNNQCAYCGKEVGRVATKDHVIPRSKGGREGGNYILACFRCNNYKSDSLMMPQDWAYEIYLQHGGEPLK